MKLTVLFTRVPKFVIVTMNLIPKIYFLIFVNVYCLRETMAQHTRLFLKTDVGFSSIGFHPARPVTPGLGYGLGLELNLKLTKKLTINPSILFVRSAYILIHNNTSKEKSTISYIRTDLPFNLDVYDGNPSHNLFVGAGPFLSLPFSGHYTDSFERKKMLFGNSASSNMRTMDAGLVTRITLSHFLNTDAQILIQYNQGLLNLNPQFGSDNIIMRSRNFYLSFLFPLEWRKRR